ncbi:MAG: hypothetical protein ACI4XL_01215 [Bacillus sp. (in: firmicutes)]
MFRVGIIMLTAGIAGALASSYGFQDYPYIRYVQAASFLVGVIGLFLMERKQVKAREAERRKKRG